MLGSVVLLMLAGVAHGQPAPVDPAPSLTPAQLVEASLDYHDPDRLWWTRRNELELHQTRPEGPSREVSLTLHPSADRFRIGFVQGDVTATGTRDGDDCSRASSSPETPFGELTCDRLAFWQRYYTFLLSVPMNLLDEGAPLGPEVTSATFDGETVDALEVRYGEGEPVYEFFFAPDTHAVVGLRFHRQDVTRDGEYIVFEGEVEDGGVRLPKARSWYMNVDDSLLGVDTIVSFTASSG
jgi:hypothetical protein